MKKWHYIFCIILFHLGLPCGYAANDGTCATRGGTHTLSLNFPLTTVSAANNVPGNTLIDIANATSSENYSVLCNCDSKHSNGAYHEIYYTADPAPVWFIAPPQVVLLFTILTNMSMWEQKYLC